MRLSKLSVVSLLAAMLFSPALLAAGAQDTVQALQKEWARINYRVADDDKEDAFKSLADRAQAATKAYPDSAPVWIWSGIIKSTYAGAKGGLGALRLAKAAKTDLEHAIELDATALNGAAYTTLGSLYYQVPGWPLGFGDDEKAGELLRRGLEIAPDDIDANYFYADYLYNEYEYSDAMQYLEKALAAPARPARPVADEGRRREVRKLMAEVQREMD